VYSNYYLIYYSLDQSPLWIDHVGYCKGPNPLLWIGHNIIVIGKRRSRPQNIVKVVITTQKKNSALPMKRHFYMSQICINKEASASLRHTHLFIERQVSELQLEKRERGVSLGEYFLYLFELSLGIVLAIYIKEVLMGFLPHEGFPG
jgi:hypothetical protein